MSIKNSSSIQELKAKAKLPAKQAGGSVVAEFFQQNRGTLAAVLPKHVSVDRLLKIALGALRTTPSLMEATTESLFGALVTCAQLGLEPNTPLGHAYLIPFRNRRENRTDVQVIFGYRGLIDLARRSGEIVSIAAHVVYADDEFHYQYGLHEDLLHIPSTSKYTPLEFKNVTRGQIVTHFYAVAKLVGGGHAFEVLSAEQVNKIRDEALIKLPDWKQKTSPWVQHYEEMGRKTAVRRLFKYLPVSIEVARASTLDATAGTDDHPDLSGVLDGEYSVDNPYAAMQEEPEKIDEAKKDKSPPSDKPESPAAAVDDDDSNDGIEMVTDEETGETTYYNKSAGFWDSELHSYPPRLNFDDTWRKRRIKKANEPNNPPIEDNAGEDDITL